MSFPSLSPSLLVFCVFGVVAVLVVGILIVILVPILGALGGAGWYLNKRSREVNAMGTAAKNWPSVNGAVISSEVVSSSYYHNHRSQVSYRPKIVYAYEVGGKSYQNDLVKAQDRLYTVSFGTSLASEVTTKYPVGKRVTVYYDPANPQESLLER